MADNVTIATVGGNRDVATDEVAAVHYQRFKVGFGVDGAFADASTAAPFPAQLRDSDGTDVTLSSKLGSTGETAPATDTAASGINGRLQRIAQRLTVDLTEVSQHHLVCSSGTNATSIKSSPGTVKAVHVYNKAAYPIYVKLHNTTGSPTPGSGVVTTIGCQAGLPRDYTIARAGRSFASGIGMTVVKDITDTGTTPVELSDAVIEVDYE